MQSECTHPSQSQNEVDLKMQLSRALLHFQDRLLEANISPGSLCQVETVKRSHDEHRLLLRDATATSCSFFLHAPSDASYLRLASGQTALSGSTQPRQPCCAGDGVYSTAQSVVRDLL